MPIVDTTQSDTPYGTTGDVLQLARVLVNDAFGPNGIEGDILGNDQPGTPVLLESAWEELQSEAADAGIETLVKTIVIPAYPVVYLVDSAVETWIDWTGSFDGDTFYDVKDGNPALPYDLIVPVRLWERPTGSGSEFYPVENSDGGFPEGQQTDRLRYYEWRSDRINFKGATTQRDLKLRYIAYLPRLVQDNKIDERTQVPIMRSWRALAYLVAAEFARPRGSQQADSLYALGTAEIQKIANRTARRKATVSYRRKPFGSH
jgi:hypothetical protein